MNPQTERLSIDGPAGAIECALDLPAGTPADGLRGLAVVCHPHPQHGGTMDNKVVQTLARAFLQLRWRVLRFNFRGVGRSAGVWDEGRGEVDDALAVIGALRTMRPAHGHTPAHPEPLLLAGFSFGAYVASQAAARMHDKPERIVLVGPATRSFAVAPVPADTLVIHGEHDDVAPLAATLDWARPQGLPVVVVPGGGHFFHGQLPLLKSLVVRALAS